MKRYEVRIVESTLERTARLLAVKHGITVRFRPGTAMTDGRIIYLPPIPDDADQDLLDAMQGYLNHEVAHILYTDFLVNAAELAKSKCLRLAEGFVEDVRIERLFEKEYVGSKYNFQNVVAVICKKLREVWENVDPFSRILMGMFLQARHPNSNFYKEVFTDEERELVNQVIDILESHKLETTADSLVIAKAIIELLQPPEPPEEATSTDVTSIVTVMLGGGKGSDGKAKAQPSAGEGSVMDAAGNLLVQVIDQAYEHDQDYKTYTVFDKSQDIITKPTDKWDPRALEEFREHAADYTAIMKQRLLSTLKSRMRARWSGGKEHGVLDSRRLHKLATGNTHVYKQRVETAKLDTAVMLMIDHSGSMSHEGRLKLSAESAIVMGDVLHQLHVPFAVAGHSTQEPRSYTTPNAQLYSRYNRLWICKHVDWNENWPTAAHRLTSLIAQNNTLDGEALRWGAQQLLARPERRKVLFWFNDGYPFPGYGDVGDCQKYLKDVVAACQKAGIEIIAFGIRSEDVKYYFPKYVLINELSDLVREPLNHLDRILREGVK